MPTTRALTGLPHSEAEGPSRFAMTAPSWRSLATEIALVVALAVYTSLIVMVTPREVPFHEQDPSLSYPYRGSTVPSSLLAVLAVVLPMVCICIGVGVRSYIDSVGLRATVVLCAWVLLAFAQSVVLCLAVTDTLKVSFSRLRPVFFSYCDYASTARAGLAAGATAADVSAYLQSTNPEALGSVSRCGVVTADAQKSFPSGHSSLSFVGLGFLTLVNRWLLRTRSGEFFSVRAFVAAWPLALAAWIAATRTWDRMHTYEDVAVGSAIGAVCALAGWAHFRSAKPSRDPDRRGDDDDDDECSSSSAGGYAVHVEPEGKGRVGRRSWLPAGVPEDQPQQRGVSIALPGP